MVGRIVILGNQAATINHPFAVLKNNQVSAGPLNDKYGIKLNSVILSRFIMERISFYLAQEGQLEIEALLFSIADSVL